MSGRGSYLASVNDESPTSGNRRGSTLLYVEVPTRPIKEIAGIGVLDILLSILVFFAVADWKASTAWSDQVVHYNYGTSSAELLVLLIVRLAVIAVCATKSRSGLVTLSRDGGVHGSSVLLSATAFSAFCAIYSLIKLGYTAAEGDAGGWGLAIVALFGSSVESAALVRLRRTIRDIAATDSGLFEKLTEGERLEAAMSEEEEPKGGLSAAQLIKVLKPYFWPKGDDERSALNRLRSTATWVFVILSKLASVSSPIFLSNATNALYAGDYSGAARGVVLYASLTFISKFLKECQSLVYLKVKQQAYIEIAEHSFTHLHNLSLHWHLKKKMGNVIRSMDRGTDAANNLVTYLFLYLVPAIAECVATVILFYTRFRDWKLATMAFVALSLYGYLTVKITLWRKKFRTETNKHDNEFHDKATDSIINYETVKYFTNEKYEVERFTKSVRAFQHFSTSTQASLSLLNIVQQLVMNTTLMAGLLLAGKSVSEGRYSVGDFVAVNTYMVQLFTPLNFLGTVYNVIIQAFVDIRNLSELLAESPDIVDNKGAPALPLPPPERGMSVEFRDIWFWYQGQPNHRGLRGISFVVPPGTTTALVGHTGAGKTTISRLLFRFYDPVRGQVLLNGHDIKQVKQQSVRRAIGVVPQDTVMFNDTILHNLKYGRLSATMAEVEKACEAAQILSFIESLPEKWETKVGERGLKLSGGEKQRVAIARCILKDPPVVLLDEATSALDTRTEHGIQEALQRLKVNRTTLVIAHRLSTIRNADQIIVLGEGQVLERGTHTELMALKGEYQQMWNLQLHEDRQRALTENREEGNGEGELIDMDGSGSISPKRRAEVEVVEPKGSAERSPKPAEAEETKKDT